MEWNVGSLSEKEKKGKTPCTAGEDREDPWRVALSAALRTLGHGSGPGVKTYPLGKTPDFSSISRRSSDFEDRLGLWTL